MKMGFRLALGQVGWSAPPEQGAIYYRKLARHMATCAMDVLPTHGLATLSRLMYTQEGNPKCTREDCGAIVCYSMVASDLRDRIKEHEQQSRKPGGSRGAISRHPIGICRVAWREPWNDIVYALPPVDSWPFCRGETKYPTPSVAKIYVEKKRKLNLGRLQHFWLQAGGAAPPFMSDSVAPTSRRNSLLPDARIGSSGQGIPRFGG